MKIGSRGISLGVIIPGLFLLAEILLFILAIAAF